MASMRQETDSLGVVDVPADKLWGAQTQRSLEYFSIGHDLMPREMISAYAVLKKAGLDDAKDSYFWVDPFSQQGQEVAAKLMPSVTKNVHSTSVSARSKSLVAFGPVCIDVQKHVPPAWPQLMATTKAGSRRAA